jgi:hypothetical protein
MLIYFLSCHADLPDPINTHGELSDQFWKHFRGGMGCEGVHLTTWSPDGRVGMDVSIPWASIQQPIAEQSFSINKREAQVMIETGRDIPVNFCVDKIALIPVQKVYHSVSGTIDLQVSISDEAPLASVVLRDITLKVEGGSHEITMPTIHLNDILISPKRKQDPNRKLIGKD